MANMLDENASKNDQDIAAEKGTTVPYGHPPPLSSCHNRNPNPEPEASIFSRIFLAWVFPLILTGMRSPLQDEDLWELSDNERSRSTVSTLLDSWNSSQANAITSDENGSDDKKTFGKNILQISILNAFRSSFIKSGLVKVIVVVLFFIQPIFIEHITIFLTDEDTPKYRGFLWAVGLFLVTVCYVLAESTYLAITERTGMRIRSSLQGVIYDKSLGLSPAARASASLGEIINLMQLDSQRIGNSAQLIHVLWAAPIQIIGTLALLINYIGWSAVVGFTLTMLAFPLQGFLLTKKMVVRNKTVLITDRRVNLMNEILQGIKAVKFYAWEKPFTDSIESHRKDEVKHYHSIVYIQSGIFTIMFVVPVIVGVVTFAFYTAVAKQELNPAKIFTGIALINQLRIPILMLPQCFSFLIDAKLGMKRIQRLMQLEDMETCIPVYDNEMKANGNDKEQEEFSDVVYQFDSSDSSVVSFKRQEETSDSEFYFDSPDSSAVSLGQSSIIIEDGEFEWSQIRGKQLGVEKKKKIFGCFHMCRSSKVEQQQRNEEGEKNGPVASSDVKGPSVLGSVLRNINIHFSQGQLHALVGQVGSGKSSLIHAILGEMRKVKGHIKLKGTVAYVAQTAWIFHGTLRDNILFGRPFVDDLYHKAIDVTALAPDIEILPAGDSTSIGEKGVNLSGGQKQRISMARAVYANADVYLFDDPLSALDANVSQHLFDKCISNRGVLGDKLRVLITNQIHVLPDCDSLLFLKDGTITGQGPFESLAETNEDFKLLINEQRMGVEELESNNGGKGTDEKKAFCSNKIGCNDSTRQKDSSTNEFKAGAKVVQEEERCTGSVGFKAYIDYINELGGVPMFIVVIVFLVVAMGLGFIVNLWLSYWSEEQKQATMGKIESARSTGFFLGVWVTVTVAFTIMTYTCTVWIMLLAFRASRKLHDKMLRSLLHAPLMFFDTTPIGRILSRFSMDISALDEKLPHFLHQALSSVLSLVLTYIFIAYILPPFLGAAVPVMCIYFGIMYCFKRSLVELKRLDAISKSPIYAHFSETLGGISTLRAYRKEQEWRETNMEKIDTSQRAFFSWVIAKRFFTLCLELCGCFLILAAAIIGVTAKGQSYAGSIALALTYALQITSFLGFVVRSITELEAQMSSVERANFYIHNLPQEAETIIKGATPVQWPKNGEIVFENVEMRYRDSLPLVLQGVNLRINPGEKIGIVGRTGSGKSSMMIALLRMIEICGGRILVDGTDLKTLGLNDVRSKITIIPQDPVMFSGTIRQNLDPFENHTDGELWDALEKSHAKQFVSAFEEGLSATVSECGENLSVGQKQIICLVRALLRKSQIVILDEASSSLDNETDALVQGTIRQHLKNATILTIAHRLLTLADYDRILVLENGKVAQLGPPKKLLEQKNGPFIGLVDSMGQAGSVHFRSRVTSSQGI